ncbi:MAG TPA: site-2 protease family protein [Lacipirellulaceae bacterium]|nr:site-2 protease family protein [Lacipirellulaceae bacterium]
MPNCCVQRWSLGLGRWWGVSVYLHIFFVACLLVAAAFTFPDSDLLIVGLLTVGVLLVSVTLHEVAHALAAIHVGGKVDAIVLGPVGGLISPRVPDEPESHLFVALAGPVVHLTLAVLAAIALAVAGNSELLGLLNPLATPQDLVEPGSLWLISAKLTLWLNWRLMLLNMLPAYPFDGGPAMRAMLWPALGRRTARIVTARVAMVVAGLICFAPLLALAGELPSQVPMWIPFVMLGTFVFFSARQDLAAREPPEWVDQPSGYQVNAEGLDLLDSMWSTDDEEEGVLVEHQQRQPPGQSDQSHDVSEDDRVDDILARLYNSNWDALSPEEVAVLQRASERYRQRRR